MNNLKKISVILPVYNAETYLNRCLDSLLAQTFTDYEVILINDGSKDRSGLICDEYAARNPHVRVIHKENGGVSSARQSGIENAKGEYTIHVDPDDWVEPSMLEELYLKAIEEDADMVICDYWEEYDTRCNLKIQKPTSLFSKDIINDILSHRLYGSCWNKLIRRTCYENVNFPEGLNYSEDAYVCINIINRNVKVVYLNKAFYHYCWNTNPNSIMKSSQPYLFKQAYLFLEMISSSCSYIDYPEGYAYQYADLAVRAFNSKIYSTKELRTKVNEWEAQYRIKTKLSKRYLILLSLSVDLYLYNFIILMLDIKRQLRKRIIK